MRILAALAALVSILLISCGDGIFDEAKRAHDGYPVAAVLVNEGGTPRVVLTDGGEYLKVYTVSGMPAPLAPGQRKIYLHERGYVFILDGMNVYASLGNGDWMSSTPSASTCIGIAGEDDSAIMLDSGKLLWEFDPFGSSPWRNSGPLGVLSYNGFRNIDEDDGIFFSVDAGSNTELYRFEEPTTSFATIIGMSAATYFDRKGGTWYAANGSGISPQGGTFITMAPSTAYSWCVIDSTTIFAGGTNGSTGTLFRLDGSGIQMAPYYIFGNAEYVLVESFDAGRLIVGINNGVNDGLYLFEYDSMKLTKIYGAAVFGIHVMRR